MTGYRDLVFTGCDTHVSDFLYFAEVRNMHSVLWVTLAFFSLVGL
jgi:hypothetical protein